MLLFGGAGHQRTGQLVQVHNRLPAIFVSRSAAESSPKIAVPASAKSDLLVASLNPCSAKVARAVETRLRCRVCTVTPSSPSSSPLRGSDPLLTRRAGRPFFSDRYNMIDVVVVALSLVALGPWQLPMRCDPAAAARASARDAQARGGHFFAV